MNTIKVAFTKKFVPGRDTAYTYQTAEVFKVGEQCQVETPKGMQTALVVQVDKEFNEAAVKRWGALKNAFKQQKAKS